MSEQEAGLNEFVSEGDDQTDEQERDQHLPEIDEIPKDWSLVTVEDVADDLVGGGTPSKSNEEYWDGNIPWASVKDLNGIELSETEDHITEAGVENSATKVIPTGSIIVSTRMTVGEPFINKVDMAINQDMKAITPNIEIVNPLFFMYSLLDKDPYLKSLGRGTTVDGITTQDLSLTHLGLPSLGEQHKIASVLYTVDQAIQQTDEVIEQKEVVKHGLMQDIFRDGLNTKGELRRSDADESHRDTKYGSAPKGWDIVPLDGVVPEDAPVTYGIVKPGDHHPGGVPVVKVENIMDGVINQEDLLHTDPEIHEQYKRAELTEGDLLFTIRGTVGRMAFVPEELEGGNLTQDTARIRINGANPRFVRYYFETATPNNYFERHTKGQAVQGINLEDLREVPVHLPSEEEQNRIVEILDSHTEQIRTERNYRNRLQRLKQGLMQDLLSGEVRTQDKDIELVGEVLQNG